MKCAESIVMCDVCVYVYVCMCMCVYVRVNARLCVCGVCSGVQWCVLVCNVV